MSIVDGIIKAPISVKDVAKAIGVNSLDVGTLCTSKENINMWSRYRPVALSTLIVNPDKIIGNSSGSFWAENKIGAASGKPWFWGKSTDRSLIAPLLSSVDDYFDSDGKVKKAAKWSMNLPAVGTDAFRLTDFLGYNHKAIPPFYGWVSPGDVDPDDTIRVGFSFATNDSSDLIGKQEGCWGAQELLDFIGTSSGGAGGMYLGVVIRNRTQNIIRSGSLPDKIVFGDTDLSWVRELKMNSESPIYYGGVGHKPRINDVLDVFVFLTSSTIENNNKGPILGSPGHSLYMSDEYQGYNQKKVVQDTTVARYYNIEYVYEVTSGSYYGDRDSFKTGRKYINTLDYGVGGDSENPVILAADDYLANVEIRNFAIKLDPNMDAETINIATSTNRKFTVRYGVYYLFSNESDCNFPIYSSRVFQFADPRPSYVSPNKVLTTGWTPSTDYIVYNSYADAVNRKNGVTLLSVIDQNQYSNAIPLVEYRVNSDKSLLPLTGAIQANASCIAQPVGTDSGTGWKNVFNNSIRTTSQHGKITLIEFGD